MSYTPITFGQTAWDVPVNAAFVSQDSRLTSAEGAISSNTSSISGLNSSVTTLQGRASALEMSAWMPGDYGLKGWSYDPATQSTTLTMATGTIYMSKIKLDVGTITALGTGINTAGSSLTAGQSFMALYDNSGTLLGQTADQSANWTTVGYKQPSLITPVVISTAGYYHVAQFSNGATPPVITRGSNLVASSTLINLNLTPANARFATAGTATTAPPASITMSSRTPIVTAVWLTAA